MMNAKNLRVWNVTFWSKQESLTLDFHECMLFLKHEMLYKHPNKLPKGNNLFSLVGMQRILCTFITI